jgi:hypothetical protein
MHQSTTPFGIDMLVQYKCSDKTQDNHIQTLLTHLQQLQQSKQQEDELVHLSDNSLYVRAA